tara:strand:- start:4189 stop:5514 length:1326 start_codon:yes stop_codon:yes gene_type:complete
MATKIEIDKVKEKIKKYSKIPEKKVIVSALKETLAEMEGVEPASAEEDCPEVISDALNSIQQALDMMKQGGGSSIDAKEVQKIVDKSKFGLDNLSKDVIDLIGSSRKIKLERPPDVEVELGGEQPEIFWIAFSDLSVGNNVYMYGGAGTGKTYTSKQLAKALNYSLITINCNQFTSPLEINGGQTIEGYQQGKLITAWGNLPTNPNEGVISGMQPGTNGCLLLLDELPKIDPNTAGLLNDALSEIKEKGTIQDSRGVRYEMKNFACVATGNSKLNEDSVDYVANFRQDLSLQDRFAGSTYELFVSLKLEVDQLMKGYLFIFLYMNKVRNAITSTEGKSKQLESQAFVSIRIMQSLRDSWRYWYTNHKEEPQVKTIIQGIESFFGLFSKSGEEWLKKESDFNGFKTTVRQMEKLPLGKDTTEQKDQAKKIVTKWLKEKGSRL